MREHSLVSILMPAYNHEAYVEQAIESVLQQSYSDIELLICDDCSTDRTPELIQVYADKYPDRITFYKGRKNRGVSRRFNGLCAMAKGQYVVPFASDDQLPADGIERRIRYLMANPEIDIVATDLEVIDGSGQKLSKQERKRIVSQFNRLYEVEFDDLYNALLYGNFLPAGSLCVRMQRVTFQDLHHDELCPNLHDYDVWLALANRYRWGFLDEPTFFYRWHGKNLSSPQTHDLQSLSDVVAQSIYILSKQLLLSQSSRQRQLTLKTTVEYCKVLSDATPKTMNPAISGSVREPVVDRQPVRRINDRLDGPDPEPGLSIEHPAAQPASPSDRQIPDLIQTGKDFLAAGRLKESCDTFIQVLDIDEVNLEAVTQLGVISMLANNMEQAGFFFKQALEIDPSCKDRINKLMARVDDVTVSPITVQ